MVTDSIVAHIYATAAAADAEAAADAVDAARAYDRAYWRAYWRSLVAARSSASAICRDSYSSNLQDLVEVPYQQRFPEPEPKLSLCFQTEIARINQRAQEAAILRHRWAQVEARKRPQANRERTLTNREKARKRAQKAAVERLLAKMAALDGLQPAIRELARQARLKREKDLEWEAIHFVPSKALLAARKKNQRP